MLKIKWTDRIMNDEVPDPCKSNIQTKGHRKTSTTIPQASCQKQRCWLLYSNENNGLQQLKKKKRRGRKGRWSRRVARRGRGRGGGGDDDDQYSHFYCFYLPYMSILYIPVNLLMLHLVLSSIMILWRTTLTSLKMRQIFWHKPHHFCYT
jgi:hypothetical protein